MLRQLMDNVWKSNLVRHNCATFAMQIVKARGNVWTFAEIRPVLGVGSAILFESLLGDAFNPETSK